MSVKITDLGDAALPLTGNELFEVAVSLQESRKLSVADLMSSAPGMDASFVTLTVNPTLPNERVLTAGANIGIVDNGPGGTVVISSTVVPGGQVDSVIGGTNITVDATDPVNPIVNLDAAIAGVSVNGVTLSNAGAATNYLDETGSYSVPPGFNPALPQTITGQWQFNLALRMRNTSAAADLPGIGQIFVTGGNDIRFRSDGGVETSLLGGGVADPLVIGSVNATSNAAINSSDNVAALNIGNTAIPGTLPIMQINSQFIQSKSSKFSSGATIFINNLGGDIQLGNANFASITINAPASGVQVKHSTAAVAFQSALPASGGLFANNLATGAGLERVLTTADLGGGASPGGANTAIQFNSAGAFGGTPNFEWDGSIMKIEASQAAIILDETDGGGTCFLRLTSTATGDSALVLEWSSSSGTNGAIRQATSSGTLQDTWINFFKDAGVGIRFNDVQKMITLATGVKMEDSIYIEEKAAANADTVTEGQVWVRTDTFSNTLMFTNDNGNDFEVAGLPLGGDVLDGTLILADTTFVGVVNIGPKPDSFYMLQYAGMVSAPAADDIKIRLIMDTASLFIGTLTDSTGQVTGLISAIGSALTNEVIIDTDGSAIPAGQTFTIQGHLHTGATAPGTMSLQAAKNADAGADGSIYFAAVAVKAMYDA